MARRGLLLTVSLCIVAAAIAWKIGAIRGQNAAAAEINEEAPAATVSVAPAAKMIAGFRSAKFGETEDAVRAAISTDFGKSGGDIKSFENPIERTKTLSVVVDDLVPETGKARIVYVLGYKSKALIQVNVLWGTAVTPETTGTGIARTGLILKSYFASQNFDPKFTVQDRKLPNGRLVFQTTDAQGHLVRLVYLEGAQRKPAGEAAKQGDADKADKKVYALSLVYVANPKAPDILSIKPGDF